MKVNVQGVGLVEFPDDAKPEEITAALNQRFPSADSTEKTPISAVDFLKTEKPATDALDLAARDSQFDLSKYKVPTRQSLGLPSYTPQEAAQEKARIAQYGWEDEISPAIQAFAEGSQDTSKKIEELSKQIPSGKELADASKQYGVPDWMAKLYTPTLTVNSSLDKVALGLASFLTSPSGAAQTGALAVPVVGEVQALKFAYDMIKGGVVNVKNAFKAIQDKDWQAFSDNAVGAVANFGIGGKLAHSKLSEFVKPDSTAKTQSEPEAATQTPAAQAIPTPEASVPEIKPLPELPPGDRLITVQRPDGTTYKATFGDKFYDDGKGNKIPAIAKADPGDKLWSHGMLGEGEKIIEEDALTPNTETTPENPPVISESGSKVKQETAPNPVEQVRMNPVDAHEFAQKMRGKTVSELRQLREDHENDPMDKSDHAIEIINQVIAEKSKSLKVRFESEGDQKLTEPVKAEPVQKYRVGNNPTLHTVVEKLPASDVEIQNGEQPVKVKNEKTGEVSTVLESDLTAVKESVGPKGKKQSVSDKLKSLGYSDAEISAMDKPGQKAIADRGFPKGQQSRGPGAAAEGEPGTYSAIQQLADQLEATAKDNTPVNEKVSAIEKAKNTASDAKEGVEKSLSGVVAISKALWKSYSELSPFTDMKRIVGRWFYANQKADHEAREFGRQIVKAVPDKARREAITNWIQADGDIEVLKAREAASKGSLKRGYKIAQSLTPRETEIAQLIREYYDRQLEKGISEGLLKEGLDNYITQVWKRENPVTRKLINELVNSKLQPNFKFARKRIFDSYFEGEQAGYVPRTKDAGALVANYDQSFNKALAARAFIKELHEGKASDGRPLVELSGNGKVVEQTGERSIEQPKSILINPKAKPEEISDYRTIDHPALRGWKFATTSPDGAAVLLKGDMLVHPEIYAKLKNRLSTSWFRQHPVPRAVLNLQSTFKQSLMSISGFHQVQEGLHALGHRVNPFNLEKIDYSDPITKAGVEHGLQLSDYNALEQFGEGLSSGKLLNKVPFLGPKLKAYNDWLFQDHIPRLKLTMFKHALERNQERYADAIKSGKITPDQVIELTASQANHAFGELPYKYWGRNPNLQDFYRTFLLAPDFLESRAGFVGQAASPGGLGAKGLLKNEQFQALAFLALTQYMIARIVNQIVDKDPHFELKNAFRIIVGNHAISLRTVPGDILHLISEPRGFLYNRLSPIVGRGGIELATSRDYRGVKRDFIDQMGDLLKSGIPISLNHKYGQSFLETLGNAFGIQNQRYDAIQNIEQKAADWKAANGIKDSYETVYDPDSDKFSALRNFIYEGKKDAAQKEFDRLKKEIPPDKIRDHFVRSLARSITGSKENDSKFYNGLSDIGKEEFKEAKDLKDARLNSVLSINGMPQLSPDYQLRKISAQMRIKPNK